MTIIIGRHVSKLSGYAPAVPTPFDDDDNVDVAAFADFCERQIREGATALVVCGTTGEAPTLRPAEHHVLVRIAVDVARGRVPVIAGAGSNSTAHAIELTKDAEAGGADAILSVVPYYNKPVQAGLYAHFSAIAQSTGLPVILYDVPSRTGCGLADETIARLAELPQIIGLKDATGDVNPSVTAEVPRWLRIQTAFRRRCHRVGLPGARRQWLHFRGVQRRARVMPSHVSRLQAAAFERGASVCGSDRATNRGPLPGSEPRSGQICAELVWVHVRKGPLAARRIDRPIPRRPLSHHGAIMRRISRLYDRDDQ